MLSFLPIYFYFILISFLASIIVYFVSDKSHNYLKLFPPFLFATLIVESIATYLGYSGRPNIWLYNFFSVIEFCFYLCIISLFITNSLVKKIIRIIIVFYAVAANINILFIQKPNLFHAVTYALGCLLIVAACVYYFFELFKFPKSVNLPNIPAFWICSGLLFFYCCGFPLYGFMNYLSSISKLLVDNFYNIFTILNIFLYTLFTIAFLCRLKVRKYTLSPS
jgi:hypothetical protein